MASTMGRAGALMISAVFAVAFGLGGYFAGLQPLAQTLQTAWQVRSWQPVPARVLSAEVRQRSDSEGGTTYEVQARYRYQFSGASHDGARVGLEPPGHSDSDHDWHQQWHRRLQTAQAANQSITVRVNPRNPTQALIDPAVRWQLQIFRVPFALVFTGVGVAAAWVFVLVLLGRGNVFGMGPTTTEGRSAQPAQPKSSLHGTAAAAWFFTFFWCGIAFPMAAMVWSQKAAPGWAKGFISIFVMVGVVLLYVTVVQTRKVWQYRGSAFTARPRQPQAGAVVQTTLQLPARAVAQAPVQPQRYDSADAAKQPLRLQLAQYRVDESSSGSPERRVQVVDGATVLQPTSEGGVQLVAQFEVPPDAAAHGALRSRERVDWRVELLDAAGAVELSYPLPVQAAPPGPQGTAADDRFDRWVAAGVMREEPILIPEELGRDSAEDDGAMAHWPPGAVLQEGLDALQIRFSQHAWRWCAAVALVVMAAEWLINGRVGADGVVLPRSLGGVGLTVALLAFALHAATRHWTLWVQDDGIVSQRGSWLWSTLKTAPGDATKAMVHKLLFSVGGGGNSNEFRAIYARNSQGAMVRLTPGLPGAQAANAVGQVIAQAWSDRRGRFAAGGTRPLQRDGSRPAWGWVLMAGLLLALWWGPLVQPPTQGRPLGGATSAPTAAPVRVWAAVDTRLLDAQDAGDAAALEQALRDGANPNLVADNGSSMLMLASSRGQLAHVNLLLRAGAHPDLRQTQKDSERGDTALLRAFYGGHLAVALRLVQAGASLQARNRWDWGPVHMAAQSGCVPCLQWLGEQGQALDDPAPASRGETPAMLAAARGHIEVLTWLENAGVDLLRRDPHGQRAVDWARFGKQSDAERWLMEPQR
ncbi:DUF3592 domain-containing protein [Acidovorax sp. LjRoot129]|uniref:ankyrin repeat domain-containing protein n=1 Tax=Acidovorax sp. LjRoot129 TaxID=3342260 RepID=UPI003ECEEF03